MRWWDQEALPSMVLPSHHGNLKTYLRSTCWIKIQCSNSTSCSEVYWVTTNTTAILGQQRTHLTTNIIQRLRSVQNCWPMRQEITNWKYVWSYPFRPELPHPSKVTPPVQSCPNLHYGIITFILAGCCYVLRLLDISLQEKQAREQKQLQQRIMMGGSSKLPESSISSTSLPTISSKASDISISQDGSTIPDADVDGGNGCGDGGDHLPPVDTPSTVCFTG